MNPLVVDVPYSAVTNQDVLICKSTVFDGLTETFTDILKCKDGR